MLAAIGRVLQFKNTFYIYLMFEKKMLHKNDCALCTFANSEPTVGPAICLLMKHFLLRRARKYATIKLTFPHCAVFSFLLAKFKFKSSSSRVSEFILATKCRSRMVLPPLSHSGICHCPSWRTFRRVAG